MLIPVFAPPPPLVFVLHPLSAFTTCSGLGVVQALPGPLFNFSAYLGAIIAMNAGYNFMVGAVLAWFGLFSPGVMIIFGECVLAW